MAALASAAASVCHHGAHVGEVLYRLVTEVSYLRAQLDAWRTMCLRLIDENRQLSHLLAAANGGALDRRYAAAWEQRRAQELEEAWQAGRAVTDAERRVA